MKNTCGFVFSNCHARGNGHPDAKDSRLRGNDGTGYLILRAGFLIIFLAVQVAGCAKRALPDAKLKGVSKFQLSGGSAISQSGTEEYNPYVVKMPDGFLALLFASDRTCGGCSGHNLFISRSVSAYANDAVFPAFASPTVFTVAATPLNFSGTINFAAGASGSNLRIFLTNAGGNIQYADISPTGSYNVAALTAITNTAWQAATVVGIDAAGTKIFARKNGSVYAFDPLGNDATLTAMANGQSASSLAHVNAAFAAMSDGYFSLSSGSIGSMSFSGTGGNLDIVNNAVAKAKITARNMSILQTGVRNGDLMFISGVEAGSSTQDMYVVDGLNAATMWDTINPKPPSAGAPGSSSGGGTTGVTWNTANMPSSASWQSVTFGNGVFVAIANGGTSAATSTDGINWTARTLPSSSNWTSVTFGGGMFVAVATSTTAAASSTDGIAWTARAMPSAAAWTAVTYGGGAFVAVATGGTTVAASSSDGMSWTARTMPVSGNWNAVAFGNSKFVALANGTNKGATSPDGITWTVQTLSTSASWISLAYGNGTFVGVSFSGTAAISSADGIAWTTQALPSASFWRSVAFGNSLFVALGNGGTVSATSADGVTWTQQSLPSSLSWYSVAFGNGVFAAVASGTAYAAGTSTATLVDVLAPTVTNVTSSTGSGYFKSGQVINVQVVFSEPVIANVGGGAISISLSTGGTASYASGSGTNTLNFNYTVGGAHNSTDLDYTSTAALNLIGGSTINDAAGNTAVLTLFTPGALYSLGYNMNIVVDNIAPTISAVAPAASANMSTTQVSYTLTEFVASGSITFTQTGGTADPGSPRVQALTGLELTTGAHTNITLTNNPALVNGAIYTVTFNATDSAGNVATTVTSTNVTYTTALSGTTWTARTLPTTANWSSVVYGSGTFVAVAYNSTIGATSPDGLTWTQRVLPAYDWWLAVAYGNSTFVATTDTSGTQVAGRSADGITWASSTMPTGKWQALTFGSGLFVALSANTSSAATSPDGITWTTRTLPVSANWTSVTFGSGTFVAVASGSNIALTSPDGINWTQRSLPASATWNSVAYGNAVFMAVSGGTAGATSPDGVTWTARTLPSAMWNAVAFGNGAFVAIGGGGGPTYAANSPDGTTWTARTISGGVSWRALTYGTGLFAALNYGSTAAATSP